MYATLISMNVWQHHKRDTNANASLYSLWHHSTTLALNFRAMAIILFPKLTVIPVTFVLVYCSLLLSDNVASLFCCRHKLCNRQKEDSQWAPKSKDVPLLFAFGKSWRFLSTRYDSTVYRHSKLLPCFCTVSHKNGPITRVDWTSSEFGEKL